MSMSTFKVFIFESLGTGVDAVTTGAITFRDIATLYNETINDSVNATTQVVQLAALFVILVVCRCCQLHQLVSLRVLSSTKASKVFCCQRRNIIVELKDDSAHVFRSNRELEKNFRVLWHLLFNLIL